MQEEVDKLHAVMFQQLDTVEEIVALMDEVYAQIEETQETYDRLLDENPELQTEDNMDFYDREREPRKYTNNVVNIR